MFSPVAPRRVDALPRMLDCRLCFGCVGNPRISLRLVVARGFSLSEGELRCEGALRPRKGGGTWDYKLVLWGAVEPNPEATWRREIREITYTSDGSHSNAGFAQSRGRREWATEESTVSARILFLREHQRRLCCVGSREKVWHLQYRSAQTFRTPLARTALRTRVLELFAAVILATGCRPTLACCRSNPTEASPIPVGHPYAHAAHLAAFSRLAADDGVVPRHLSRTPSCALTHFLERVFQSVYRGGVSDVV
mmetsp:Transcript_47747/g.147285  ORF Transcript_47747/g.147285 Transcript_47747/m.147285 type:complete len:252 (+) Transcript_47747:178-933(+)